MHALIQGAGKFQLHTCLGKKKQRSAGLLALPVPVRRAPEAGTCSPAAGAELLFPALVAPMPAAFACPASVAAGPWAEH